MNASIPVDKLSIKIPKKDAQKFEDFISSYPESVTYMIDEYGGFPHYEFDTEEIRDEILKYYQKGEVESIISKDPVLPATNDLEDVLQEGDSVQLKDNYMSNPKGRQAIFKHFSKIDGMPAAYLFFGENLSGQRLTTTIPLDYLELSMTKFYPPTTDGAKKQKYENDLKDILQLPNDKLWIQGVYANRDFDKTWLEDDIKNPKLEANKFWGFLIDHKFIIAPFHGTGRNNRLDTLRMDTHFELFNKSMKAIKEYRNTEAAKYMKTLEGTGRDKFNYMYDRLQEFAPNIIELLESAPYPSDVYGKSQFKSDDAFMALSVEGLEKDSKGRYIVAMAHYYEEFGDLMCDPCMTIRVDTKMKTVEAMSFKMDGVIGQSRTLEVYGLTPAGKEGINLREKNSQNSFLNKWTNNLVKQGHKVSFREIDMDQEGHESPEIDVVTEMEMEDSRMVDEITGDLVEVDKMHSFEKGKFWSEIFDKNVDSIEFQLNEYKDYLVIHRPSGGFKLIVSSSRTDAQGWIDLSRDFNIENYSPAIYEDLKGVVNIIKMFGPSEALKPVSVEIVDLDPMTDSNPLSTQLRKLTGSSYNSVDFSNESGGDPSIAAGEILVHRSTGAKFRLPAAPEPKKSGLSEAAEKFLKSNFSFLFQISKSKLEGRGTGGMDINLFKTSFFGKLKTKKKAGQQELVDEVLSYVKVKQKEIKKPIFTDRHAIWKLAENLYTKADEIPVSKPVDFILPPQVKYEIFQGLNHLYKNQFTINKAIEEFLDSKSNDYIFSNEEKEFFAKYEGYGGLAKEGATGRGLLWEYYTPEVLIKKMWGLCHKYGHRGGKICDPATGTGRFLNYASPQDIITAYEISEYSARICRIMHPRANVIESSFSQHFYTGNVFNPKFEKDFDLVIGNPPYGEFIDKRSVAESKRIKAANARFEHYFILRGLDMLKSGGLLTFVSTANLYLKGYEKVKQRIAEKSDLVDGYLLPNSTFRTTKINTSIIVLRRK